MCYKIVIPSYKREKIIKEKTLRLLDKHYIDKKNIYIFVEEDELEIYKKELLSDINQYNIIKGAKGIGNQREAISNYFEENENILTMDDDIEEIYDNGKPLVNLHYFIVDTINFLNANHLTLAGVYPVNNQFFTKETITTDNRFLIGQFKIFINKKHLEKRKYELLEDYENTMKHAIFSGGVMRYNYITLKANYNSGKGGLKEYRTLERKIDEVKKFAKQYKSWCKTKKDGLEIQILLKPLRDEVTTLWIGKDLNKLSKLAIASWLRLGYNINLYINQNFNLPLELKQFELNGQLKFYNANDILDSSKIKNILPFSDLWRYTYLYNFGGCWLDADMVLLKKLPEDKIIISSEHTFQSGAFKSKDPQICNIGVLRMPKGCEILKTVIDKINAKGLNNTEFCENMIIFRKIINKSHYKTFIKPPDFFCPVPWWNADDIYKSNHYKTKYNVEVESNDWILENSYALHCWNNFTYNKHDIDFSKIKIDSLYHRLFHHYLN